MSNWKTWIVLMAAVLLGATQNANAWGQSAEAIHSLELDGHQLGYWISQATAADGPENLSKTVAALTRGVRSDNPKVKVAAADALAALGAKAKSALPALLDQFNHEFNWVRVSCQAAVGSMGKQAVPGADRQVRQQRRRSKESGCIRLGRHRPRRWAGRAHDSANHADRVARSPGAI